MISTIDRACNIHMLQIQISSYRMVSMFADMTVTHVLRDIQICSICISLARSVVACHVRMHAKSHGKILDLQALVGESRLRAVSACRTCMFS